MRWAVSLMVVPVMVLSSLTMVGLAADLPGIPPETVTDCIHAVIEADCTFSPCRRAHAEAGRIPGSGELARGEEDLAVTSSVSRRSERPVLEDWNEGSLPVDQSVADQSEQWPGR